MNAAFLVGHSMLRRAVMGADAVRELATQEQIAAMAELLDESLAAGALGFSSGWDNVDLGADGSPVPSRVAGADEFLALADVVGRHDGTTIGFFPHMGELPQDRMELMTEMSLTANRPVNWNLLDGIAEFHAVMQLDEAGRRAALSDPEVRRGLHHAIGRAATGAFAAVASFDRWRARAEIWRDRRVIVGGSDAITVRGATAGADTAG